MRAPFVEAAEGLLYGRVCGGWAKSKHAKTLSPAKASFGAGSVPDLVVLVPQAVLALDPQPISNELLLLKCTSRANRANLKNVPEA